MQGNCSRGVMCALVVLLKSLRARISAPRQKTAGRPEDGGDTAAARIKGSSRESAGDGTCEEGGMWINKRLRLDSALAWSPKNVGLR